MEQYARKAAHAKMRDAWLHYSAGHNDGDGSTVAGLEIGWIEIKDEGDPELSQPWPEEEVIDHGLDEVAFLAIVQMQGLVGDNVTASKGFAFKDDALFWTREQVEQSVGGVTYIIPHITTLAIDFGGCPRRFRRNLWSVVSEEGPVWGMVVEIGDSIE